MHTFFSRLFHTYKGKWLIAIFSICFMMFFLLIFDRIVITRQFLYQREIQRVNHVGSLLLNFIGDNMLQHDTNDIKMIITKSMEQPDITLVSVLDTNKIIRYSSQKEFIGKTNPFIDSGIDAVNGEIYYKTFPLIYENTNLGFVQVGYSLGKIRQNFSASFYRILFIELLLFCAILFFAWRITESLFHDLTSSNEELREKTVELEKSNRKLLELDKLKSDFVSLVSHELKTPLTLIIGFAKTILTLDLTEEQKVKYLSIIEAEGKRLAHLVENYLDITNIEAGTLSLVREKVNVNDLVREVVEYFTREPGRRIDLEIPPDLGLIEGDGERLKRVLINLLENALRYGPAQETVVISARELTDSLVLRVTDKGPGVKKEEREKIFDKFFRGADTITQRTKGSGLGLAIAKGIVEAHGGTLWVESEPGMGATFCFSVPKNA